MRHTPRVLEAAFWGLVGGLALVLGAVIALVPSKPITIEISNRTECGREPVPAKLSIDLVTTSTC